MKSGGNITGAKMNELTTINIGPMSAISSRSSVDKVLIARVNAVTFPGRRH